MRICLTITLAFVSLLLEGQSTSLFVNDNVDRALWESGFDINERSSHSALRSQYRPSFSSDSSKSYLNHTWNKGFISPVFSLGGDLSLNDSDSELAYHGLLGLSVSQDIGQRIAFDAALYGGVADGSPSGIITAATKDVYPGLGTYMQSGDTSGFLLNGVFSLRFTPSDIFTLELGKGKHFFGDGYRSLFLSDNASPYPYFKLNTKVWNINYTNLFSWQQGMFDISDPDARFEDKFTSTHVLSWNVTSRFNFQVFETIIWQSEDSLSQRGFDVSYLNPIIFYRPVEFASGSADNAIIGFGFNYKVYPSYLIYGQLAFDEFLLDQFRAQNGWWANKFGTQLGLKGFDAFGVEGLYIQAEFNLARPFTYSHGSPVQNYAHLNQALAHPLGANFYEGILIGVYDWDRWEIRNQLSYTLKGDDKAGRNLGGDIFRSYVNPYQDLGNFIGQGVRTEGLQNSMYLSRVFHKASDTRIMMAYHLRSDHGELNQLSHGLSLTIRSNMGDGFR